MLIVGCGYIGTRLAQRLMHSEKSIQAIVKSPDSASKLHTLGISAISCDLDKESLPTGSTQNQSIFYFAPPPSIGEKDTRMARFLDGLDDSSKPSRIIYISTTGIYGDCAGHWVDENSLVKPAVDRAKRRWHAENLLQAWRKKTGGELVILRVAGIYGPGKLPLERLRKQAPMISEQEAPWTNRIHADDLVEACIAAMQHGKNGEVYNACDDTPGNMTDYFNQVADMGGLPRPPVISLAEAQTALSSGLLSYLQESRRISNAKLRNDLGVDLRYPSLREGLPSCFKFED